jgi:hypothetical protein
MKLRPLEAELFHADKETYMTKLIVVFCNFAKAPNKNGAKSVQSSNKLTLKGL